MLMHQRGDLAAHFFACGGIALLQGFIGEHEINFVGAVCQRLFGLGNNVCQRLVACGKVHHGGNVDAFACRQPCAALRHKRRIPAHGGNFADALRGAVSQGVNNGGGVVFV